MKDSTPSFQQPWVGQRILISLKAAFFGWLSLLALLALMLGVNLISRPNAFVNGMNPFGGFLLIAAGSGFTVFVIWLIVLIPIALLIPDRSFLWKPWVLTAIGLIAGPVIVLTCGLYNLEQNPTIQPRMGYLTSGIYFPGVPSAIIGGVTGAFAARLHARAAQPKRP